MTKLIRNIVECCLFYIVKLFALLYPYSLAKRLRYYKSKIYTYWLSSELKSLGKHCVLHYPIDLRGGKFISIGEQTGIGSRGIITAWETYKGDSFHPEIIIGNNVWVAEECHITAINKIQIGNNVLVGKKVTITDNSHGKAELELLSIAPADRPLFSKGPVIIEDGVWIGDKATILAGVRIEKNAIIGANALVTKDVKSNCVVGGNPAIVLKVMDKG